MSHAIHNEQACDYLLASQQFNDWVITTAFYSALHFVQHEMFPLTDDGKTYTDFNVYYRKVLKRRHKKLNKHSATIKLVNFHLSSCASNYRWLHDACMNARYTNYNVSPQKALFAKQNLIDLKKHLKKATTAVKQ